MPQTPPHPRQKGAAPDPETDRLAAELAAYAGSDAEYTQYREADDEDLGPPPGLSEALAALEASGTGAEERDGRRALGVPAALIDDMAWLWRAQATLPERLALAEGLWASGIHEAMLAAAKLLTQARLRPDEGAWALILGWAPEFRGPATSDAACSAAGRRLLADPSRMAQVAEWLDAPNPWTRRAALLAALPFARLNHLGPEQAQARQIALDWCARLSRDPDPRVVRAVEHWIRTLAKHGAEELQAWLATRTDLPKGLRRAAEKGLGLADGRVDKGAPWASH
ncbi:DNA alkylation repair protein [Paenirhodobacter sp.]|uniref:DNA alkylation repair protein n=1 Tax=Paenirhodobacter sp. TaxID=1965326 RepID=UPI003B3C6709